MLQICYPDATDISFLKCETNLTPNMSNNKGFTQNFDLNKILIIDAWLNTGADLHV